SPRREANERRAPDESERRSAQRTRRGSFPPLETLRSPTLGIKRLFVLLFPHVIAPHVFAFAVKRRLADRETGIDKHLVNGLAGPDILESAISEVDLEEEVLHAVGTDYFDVHARTPIALASGTAEIAAGRL